MNNFNKKIFDKDIYTKMKFDNNMLIMTSVLIAVLLNLILPLLMRPLIPERLLKQDKDDSNDTILDSLIKMLIHHEKNKFSSSLIIALVVTISISLGLIIKIRPSKVKSISNNY